MTTVTKDMLISDVLKIDINTARVFFEKGMYCVGCPSASGESIEDACIAHGVDANELIDGINDYLKSVSAVKV